MGTAKLDGNVSIAGMGFPVHISVEDEGGIGQQVTVPMAYAGTVKSGGGTTDGVIEGVALTTTITAADNVDVYWVDAAGDPQIVYGGDVSDVTDDEITCGGVTAFSGNLPANGYAVIIAARKVVTTAFLGTDVSAIAASCSVGRSHIAFIDTAVAELAVDIANGEGYFWIEGLGYANPITGDDIDEIWVSTADITSDQTFSIGILYDSVA